MNMMWTPAVCCLALALILTPARAEDATGATPPAPEAATANPTTATTASPAATAKAAEPAPASVPEKAPAPAKEKAAKPVLPWYADWFEPELSQQLLKEWNPQTLDLGWSQARIYHHTPLAGVKAVPKTIVAILPKESISYPKAFNRLLAYIGLKFPGSTIILCHFQKKEENFPKILTLAKERKADLFFTIGSESMSAAAKYYVGCGIPVVTCVNKDPMLLGLLKDAEKGSGNNIAYTTVNMTADSVFLWVMKFRPDLKRIGLVYDKQHKEVNIAEVAPFRELFRKKGIEVIDVEIQSPATVKADLEARMPKVLEQMRQKDPELKESLFLLTSCNSLWEQPGLGYLARLADNCPILSTVTDAVTGGEDGAMIGIGLDRGTVAHLAAVYAGRILAGREKPQNMPLGRVSPPDISISFKKARQIGVAVPFEFFENASYVFDYDGKCVLSPRADDGAQAK